MLIKIACRIYRVKSGWVGHLRKLVLYCGNFATIQAQQMWLDYSCTRAENKINIFIGVIHLQWTWSHFPKLLCSWMTCYGIWKAILKWLGTQSVNLCSTTLVLKWKVIRTVLNNNNIVCKLVLGKKKQIYSTVPLYLKLLAEWDRSLARVGHFCTKWHLTTYQITHLTIYCLHFSRIKFIFWALDARTDSPWPNNNINILVKCAKYLLIPSLN